MDFKAKISSLAVAFIASTAAVNAAAELPYTFAAGQPARAAEVNANFQYLNDAVQQQQWDAAQFKPTTISRAIFSSQRGNTTDMTLSDCDRITMDYSDPDNLVWERWRSSDQSICFREIYHWESQGDGSRIETGYTGYDPSAPQGFSLPVVETVYDAPRLLPGNWRLGVPDVFASTAISTDFDADGVTILSQRRQAIFESFEPLGTETVNVPAGVFTGCLKLQRFYRMYKSLQWRCPDVGTVKEVRIYDAGYADIRELIATESLP